MLQHGGIILGKVLLLGCLFSCAPMKTDQASAGLNANPCQDLLSMSQESSSSGKGEPVFSTAQVRESFRCILMGKKKSTYPLLSLAFQRLPDRSFVNTAQWLRQSLQQKALFLGALKSFPSAMGAMFSNPKNLEFLMDSNSPFLVEIVSLLVDVFYESPRKLNLHFSDAQVKQLHSFSLRLAQLNSSEQNHWLSAASGLLKRLEHLPLRAWKSLDKLSQGTSCGPHLKVQNPLGLTLQIVAQAREKLDWSQIWEPYRLWHAVCGDQESLMPADVLPLFEILVNSQTALRVLQMPKLQGAAYDSILQILAQHAQKSQGSYLVRYLKDSMMRPDRWKAIFSFMARHSNSQEWFLRVNRSFPNLDSFLNLSVEDFKGLKSFLSVSPISSNLLREWQSWVRDIGPGVLTEFGAFIEEGRLEELAAFLELWTQSSSIVAPLSPVKQSHVAIVPEDQLFDLSANDFECAVETESLSASYECGLRRGFPAPLSTKILATRSFDQVAKHLKRDSSLLSSLVQVLAHPNLTHLAKSDKLPTEPIIPWRDPFGNTEIPLGSLLRSFADLEFHFAPSFYHLIESLINDWNLGSFSTSSVYQEVLSEAHLGARFLNQAPSRIQELMRQGLSGQADAFLLAIEKMRAWKLGVALRNLQNEKKIYQINGAQVLDFLLWESKSVGAAETVLEMLSRVHQESEISNFYVSAFVRVRALRLAAEVFPGPNGIKKRRSLDNLLSLLVELQSHLPAQKLLLDLAKILQTLPGEQVLMLHEMSLLTLFGGLSKEHYAQLQKLAPILNEGLSEYSSWAEFLARPTQEEISWFRENNFRSHGKMSTIFLLLWRETQSTSSFPKRFPIGNPAMSSEFLKKLLKLSKPLLTQFKLDHRSLWGPFTERQNFVIQEIARNLRAWKFLEQLQAMREEPAWFEVFDDIGKSSGRQALLQWAQSGSLERLLHHIALLEQSY